jgi:hypothetical protein
MMMVHPDPKKGVLRLINYFSFIILYLFWYMMASHYSEIDGRMYMMENYDIRGKYDRNLEYFSVIVCSLDFSDSRTLLPRQWSTAASERKGICTLLKL